MRIKKRTNNLGHTAYIIFLFIFFLKLSAAISQNKDDLKSHTNPNYIPPSPNAAALINYVNIPVNEYTGVPNISIPLFNLKTVGADIPVTLSYHTSALKVAEIPSMVGSGWTLNAGGAITRVVKGIPDEEDDGYIGKNQRFANEVEKEVKSKDFLRNIMAGNWDSEPDVFYINCLGLRGTFVFDNDGKSYLLPHRSIEIQPELGVNDLKSWTITDESGVQYVFGKIESHKEITKSFNTLTKREKTFVSSWYLSEIVYPNKFEKDKVEFEYSSGEEFKYVVYGETANRDFVTRTSRSTDGSYFLCWPDAKGGETKEINTEITIQSPKYISSILSKFGSVNFNTVTGREDLTNGRFLGTVVVKNHVNGIVVAYSLDYSYFKSSPDCTSELCKRLKLERISEVSQGKNIIRYSFEYNPENIENLPPRNSFAVDHWGYYNDNLKEFRVPSWYHHGNSVLFDRSTAIEGADKNPTSSLNKAQANILTKIINPLGGSIDFKYDIHRYKILSSGTNGVGGGLRIVEIIERDGISNKDKKTSFSYSGGEVAHVPSYVFYTEEEWELEDPEYNCLRRWLNRQSSSILDLYDLNGTHVGYSTVTSSIEGSGSTTSTYTNFSAYNDIPEVKTWQNTKNEILSNPYYNQHLPAPFDCRSFQGWKRGLIKSKTVKNSAGKAVTSNSFTYNFEKANTLPAIKEVVGLRAMAVKVKEKVGEDLVFTYELGSYKMISEPVFLVEMKERFHDEDDQNSTISNTTLFEYDPNYFLPIRTTSENDITKVKYITSVKYPFNYAFSQEGGNLQTNMIKTLFDQHRINEVIESVNYVEKLEPNKDIPTKKAISGTIKLFDNFETESKVYPSQILTFNSPNGISSFGESAVTNFTFSYQSNKYLPSRTFLKYDGFGNLLEYKDRDDINKSILHGYSRTLPTCIVESAHHNEINHTSFEEDLFPFWSVEGNNSFSTDYRTGKRSLSYSNATLSTVSDPQTYILSFWIKNYQQLPTVAGAETVSEFTQTEEVNGWRHYNGKFRKTTPSSSDLVVTFSGTGLLDEVRLYPEGASMSTYTHDPLIGVTSVTDTNDKSVYYEYDEFNRLKIERDTYGNILKSYKYNYKKR